MALRPHELSEEFPEFVDKMHTFQTSDAHFEKLFDEYHDINRVIHRAETDVEPTDDVNMESMRKKRMVLKDQIYGMLNAA